MVQLKTLGIALHMCALAGFAGSLMAAESLEPPVSTEQLKVLQQQNQALQEQLHKQQELIDALTKKVGEIQQATTQRASEVHELESKVDDVSSGTEARSSSGLNKVSISGEGGIGFLKTGSEGAFPKGDFRVDEARLFFEAPVHEDVYFFSEVDLALRHSLDLSLQLGETYLDFENVSKLWNQDRTLNIRLGRMYIPFGEEYMRRYAIDNPLISHSLSDLWGYDQGLEFYGGIGPVRYAMAVQNGGDAMRDFTSDKSVAGRISYDPLKWLHLSVSGMRTGDLSLQDDWSAMWFGGGWFVPANFTNTSPHHAELVEGDVGIALPHGSLRAFGGYIHLHENDPSSPNRDVYYYSVEGVHDIVGHFYGAVRFSQIFAPKGVAIVGNGSMGDYMLDTSTTELWRLSLGLGYRFSRNLILKGEYSFERGKELGGGSRNNEDLFGVEMAFRF